MPFLVNYLNQLVLCSIFIESTNEMKFCFLQRQKGKRGKEMQMAGTTRSRVNVLKTMGKWPKKDG